MRGGEKLNEDIKNYLLNEPLNREYEAINTIVSTLYFNDNSDFKSALWETLNYLLDGKISEYAGDRFLAELYRFMNDGDD